MSNQMSIWLPVRKAAMPRCAAPARSPLKIYVSPEYLDDLGGLPQIEFKWIGNARSALGLGEHRGSSLFGLVKDLQANFLDLAARAFLELWLQNVIGSVSLFGIDDVPADWMRH